MTNNIFIQARMSSNRFPGKVLAPFLGKPLVQHIIERAQQVKGAQKVVVLTSTNGSDDPLESYLKHIGCDYFRGDLGNVFERFQEALKVFPCDYFVRLSADSPFLDPNLIDGLLDFTVNSEYDFISNVFNRGFPKGQSVEIARSEMFLKINSADLSESECEHVMPYFYNHRNNYKTLFFEPTDNLGHINMCVDTIEDLRRLENQTISYNFDKSTLSCVTI